MIIFLFHLAFASTFAFKTPQVNVIVENEKQEVWLIKESRSPWSVAHLCFQSPELSVSSLPSFETLFSLIIEERAEEFLFHGVELHQRVREDEVCLQIGALKEEIPWALDQSLDIIQKARWKRKVWKEMQILYREEVRKEAGRLNSLHQLAESVIWSNEHWVDWDWKYRQVNRKYRRFQKSSKIKLVIIGDWSEEEIKQQIPQLPTRFHKRIKISSPWKIKKTKQEEFSIPECALVQIDGFPQLAVSQRFSFPKLTSTELQYLSLILGYGTRSRLMEELREKRGLVYSLGTQVDGKDIIVRYSIGSESLEEAMGEVVNIVKELRSKMITETEFLRAKGVLTQRYYRIIEDYQNLASVHTLYSNSNSWSNIAQKKLSYSYEQFPEQIQYSNYNVIITGLFSDEMQNLRGCQNVEKIAFSQLVELKSAND